MAGCRPLDDQEISRVLSSFQGKNKVRNRTFFIVGYRTGFRASELLQVTLKDVFQHDEIVDRMTIQRMYVKNKTESRTVVLHPQAKEALRGLIKELHAKGNDRPDTYLFQSREGDNRPITRNMAYKMLQKVFRQAKLQGKLGTHVMRKIFSNKLYDQLGRDLVRLQACLGHRWITSTSSYISFRTEEIEQAIVSVS